MLSDGVRQVEQAPAEMPDHSMLVEELLIIELLGQHLLAGSAAVKSALIRKKKFLCPDQFSGLLQDAGIPHPGKIKEQNSRIDIIGMNGIFSVMIPGCCILIICDIRVIKQANIPVEEDVRIQV